MPAAGAPDDALIDASRNGDCAAFAQIVERYQRAVYAVSYSSLRDHALCDDVTQDTFVTAWRQLGELRNSARLPAWLCGIARNHARDARKRKRHEPAGDDMVELAEPTTPFDALSDAQSERLLSIALGDVPDVYREPLVLFYYEQRSVEDVARVLGISQHTTNKRLSRGRQQLAARVGELVDRKLGLRGPKRDLAACVVAAIAVLGPATSANAAPATGATAATATTKGFTMPKLVLATIVVAATVAGVGLLAADAPSRRPSPARANPSPSTTAPAPTRSATASKHATPTTTPAKAASRAPAVPKLPSPAVAPVAPDCVAVGLHMAELELGGFESARHMPEAKRTQFIQLRAKDRTRRCIEEKWPEDRRICVMGADDHESTRVDCVEGIVATPDELVAIPRELACDVVAKHIVHLMTLPGGKLSNPNKLPANVSLAKLTEAFREGQTAECERIPWSLAARRCITASKTNQDMSDCMWRGPSARLDQVEALPR